ncbi:hypothetical protein OF387_15165 [Lentilactobacillus hilgardii]|nr:hypothetical protein [Lentilactobacillus hilgardii]MCV3742573.1 hypothetical protein [Lentilactobacillus hilgardii]
MFIYVTFDSNGFVTDYKKVETDGYTKVFVLDSWINQFAQYPDKFRYDATNQKLLNPGNLPDVSLNTLNQDFTKLQTTMQNSQTQIQGITESNSQSAQALTALAQNQSALAVQVQQALASVTALAQDNSQASKASNDKTSSNASSTPTTSVTK